MVRLGSLFTMKTPTTPPPADLFWTCEVCGPVEPLFLPFNRGRWIKRSCQCQRQARMIREEAERHQMWLAEQRRQTFGGWLGERWADPAIIRELSQKTFATFDASLFPEAYARASAFADKPTGTMIFYGPCGVGKTHLEAAICNFLREERRVRSLFVSSPLFFTAYHHAMKHDLDYHTLLQRATQTPVLVLDDIDKARPTEARWDLYYLLIDERYKARRPTILSTNKVEELGSYIGDAALSRLSRGVVYVEMIGTDYRQEEE
jgi:chromosomal replication initiation ATPase DnaA